jgi:hypothetical protein
VESIFYEIWQALEALYYGIARAGYTGCIIALAGGYFLSRRGTALTGREASFSGPVSDDRVDLRYHPAIEGSARGPLGRFIGVLLKLGGTVLFIVGLLALARVFMYGPA